MADEIELLRLVSELIPEPTAGAWDRARAAIAAAREEDQVRQDAQRSARNLPAAAGTTRRAARHRRRAALRPAAAVATALAAGAAVLAAVGFPGGGHRNGAPGPGAGGTGAPPVTAAYVVQRADSALSAAEPGEVAQVTVTTTGSAAPLGGTAEEWSHGGQWRSVTRTQAGQPVYDEGFSPSSGYILVNYRTRTWARQAGLGAAPPVPPASGPRSCEPGGAALAPLVQPGLPGLGLAASSLPSTVASALRTAISCGTLVVAGRQRVGGTEAIELTSRPGSLIAETIWVSPSTYLPVRVVIRPPSGAPVPDRTADITWLRPTAQNLAALTVPVPAGFRQVPFGEAGKITP